MRATTALLPWGLRPPFAVRRVRLVVVWLVTVCTTMAVSVRQRQRYYVGEGKMEYLVISDRALRAQAVDPCLRRIARLLVAREPFTVLDPAGGSERVPPPDPGRSG